MHDNSRFKDKGPLGLEGLYDIHYGYLEAGHDQRTNLDPGDAPSRDHHPAAVVDPDRGSVSGVKCHLHRALLFLHLKGRIENLSHHPAETKIEDLNLGQ